MSESTDLFELGKLYCDRGDFEVAVSKLQKAAQGFFEAKDFKSYLKCENLLLRIYAELEQHEEINKTKEKLQDLVLKEGIELTSKTYYTLGVCAFYKDQLSVATDYFQKSLNIALAQDDKESICYAISGIAIAYYQKDMYQEALKEVYNLQVFFQVLDLPELKIAVQILNANIFRKLKKFDQAIDVLWQCYDQLKQTKVMTSYVNLLFSMGSTYLDAGDKDLAKLYLNLALKSVDAKNMRYLSKRIIERIEELGGDGNQAYDLVFDSDNHSVVEKKLGRIEFKNQFILLDLLRLFVQHPGQVYSKESLVESVWKQSYDPSIHDNKIYVTIKRLRKMIEPDYEKPKYIFRAKNGYYLNKSARILFEKH